ncbi:hypothetical protein [Agathobaculum sp. Marseille-P7918]|uniref:hypothetical protein n=1 Tax=Agathobaculum sp. Marseille-P7918 TaxID=2479843 RepID=UPI00356A896E
MNSLVFIVKLLVVLAVAFAMIKSNCISIRWAKTNVIFVIAFALLAQTISTFLPPVTDTITIQALGEKNTSAQADEVLLNAILVDGETIEIPTPENGKWFWIGENYAWRNESDGRQPQGTTREITLQIPVGTERFLQFTTSPWSGMCKVSSINTESTIDTYSEVNGAITVQLGKSASAMLIRQAFQQIAVFTLVFVILSGILWQVERLYQRLKINEKEQWKKAVDRRIAPAIISVVVFFLMIKYADVSSFWTDEVAQVSFASKGIIENILICIRAQDFSPPLYDIVCSIWYRIAPYGEQWLLLVSIVPTVLAVYFIGRMATELTGSKFAGVFCSLLMATSSTVWLRQAYELRSYALPSLFISLALYIHVIRQDKKGFGILFSLSIAALAMSHYFGMLVCGLFFLADAFLYWKKRISLKKLIGYYIFPAVLSVAWVAVVYFVTLRHVDSSQLATWYPVPALAQVKELIVLLAGNNNITVLLFILGFTAAVVSILLNRDKDYERKHFYLGFCCISIVLLIGAMFIYGNYINTVSTKWEIRYFLVLTPFVWLVTGLWLDMILRKMDEVFCNQKLNCRCTAAIFLAITLSTSVVQAVKTAMWPVEPYRQSADWLYEQANDIYDEKTAVLVMTTDFVADGWSEYYLTKQGRRDPINCYNIYQFANPETELLEFDKLYIQYTLVGIPQNIQVILDEHFELLEDRTDLAMRAYLRK